VGGVEDGWRREEGARGRREAGPKAAMTAGTWHGSQEASYGCVSCIGKMTIS